MKTIGNYLYGLNLITQTPDDSGNNAAGEALPQASSEDIQEVEADSGEQTPDSTSPEEAPEETEQNIEQPEGLSDFESATSGLNLNPDEEALLDVITSLGGKDVTNKQILNDPATPFKLRDDPNKLREVLGKMAREHKLISRGDVGWNIEEVKSSDESGAVYDREDEEGPDYGAIDTVNKYASDFGGSGRGNPFLNDHVEIRQVFLNSFKSKSLISD